jgi:hypothetical protein
MDTPNNKTILLKSITEELGIDVPRLIGELLPQLEPAKQADVLLELMSYIYPKRKAIELSCSEVMPMVAPEVSREELEARVMRLRLANDLTQDE